MNLRSTPWAALAVMLGGASLAGCGFQPLYGNPATVSALGRIDVVAPQGRTGFLVREQLQDQLALQRGAPPLYRMIFDLTQVRAPLGARVNNIANRYELGLTVRYTLTEVATGRVVRKNAVALQVSYDSPDPPYAGVVAEQDAEKRAANQAAILIRLDLARFFVHLTL